MENKSVFIFEAGQIGNYLLGTAIQDPEKNTYAEAMQKLNIQFSDYEQKLWSSMMKGKGRMACIDAALALKDPNNNTRRKIFTMLAILEASPNYTSYFLSRKFSFFYLFKIIVVGMRAVARAVAGMMIVNNIKRKCS
ncbi:MAG: hypothetical protein NTX97_14940 [Bacteroidetes bacterium]|nr:hypothetical protein [Bacteroidota bacterium]